jgi:hypothetical protein
VMVIIDLHYGDPHLKRNRAPFGALLR